MKTQLSEKIKKIGNFRPNPTKTELGNSKKPVKNREINHSENISMESFRNSKKMENNSYFLLKKTKPPPKRNFHGENSQNQKEFSFQNTEKNENTKYNFRKLSDSLQKVNEKQFQPSFFLKNDYIQMPNRVFLSQKMSELDQKTMDSMLNLLKRLKSENENRDFERVLPEIEPKKDKNLQVSDLPLESMKNPFSEEKKIVNFEKKDKNSKKEGNVTKITETKKNGVKLLISREENIQQLLKRTFSQKLHEIHNVLMKKPKFNKKVIFQV